MRALTLRDGCFHGKASASACGQRAHHQPQTMRWERVPSPPADFYTDICIPEAPAGAGAVAWLIEPPSMPGKDGHYRWVEERRSSFRAGLTYMRDLLDDPFYRFYPHGGASLTPIDYAIRKTKAVSLLASPKRLSEGHRMRHEAIQRFGVDAYGTEYSPWLAWDDNKPASLLPYRFTVVIENGRFDYYFTEKVIDAFLTRTVPLYWGCPSIGNFFDARGVLAFETLDELGYLLGHLDDRLYDDLAPFVDANCKAARQFMCVEDWLTTNLPDLMEGTRARLHGA